MANLPRNFPLLFGLLFVSSGTSAFAQTGAALPKAEDYNKASAFAGAPATGGIQGVDLRPYFPPVGEQSMNDCTAWAVAAAKSCLEALDQGWIPNQPATMFSPAFIYPQINHGADDGSSVIDAALLMQNVGAATWKTTPYIPHKTTKPSLSHSPLKRPSAFRFRRPISWRTQSCSNWSCRKIFRLWSAPN